MAYRIQLLAALLFVGACSESSAPPTVVVTGETVEGNPSPPVTEAPAFPLRNVIAYNTDRFSNYGDVFLINIDGTSRKRITDGSGRCPAISPDGNAIAYNTANGLRIVGLGITTVTVAGETGCPVWSPDRTRILVPGFQMMTLYSTNGTLVARLTSPSLLIKKVAWSPDSKTIAYATCVQVKGPCSDYSVNVVPVATFSYSSSRTLTTGGDPSYSPDGKTLAFTCGNLDRVCTMPSDGGIVTDLAAGTMPSWSPVDESIAYACGEFVCIANALSRASRQLPARATNFSWSPDGQALALTWGRLNTDVHLINADGANLRNLTSDRSHDELGGWGAISPGLSTLGLASRPIFSAGTKTISANDIIYQGGSREASQLRFVDRTGSSDRALFATRLHETCPSISPDRRMVAFESSGVWVAAVDGSAEIQLSDSVQLWGISCPVWSPDGKRIAFIGGPAGQMALWIATLGDPAIKLISRALGFSNVVWAPDGQSILYRKATVTFGIARLFQVSITGSETSFGDSNWEHPSYSVDGKLAVECGAQICIVASNGTAIEFTQGKRPLWSPDAKRMLFQRGDNYYAMNLDGTGLMPVVTVPFETTWVSWSPQSDAIVFEGNANVNVAGLNGFIKQITYGALAVRPSWTSVRADQQ